jgi:hypothetical protein
MTADHLDGSTPSELTTLWSFIGMRVEHADGGGGQIESAFVETLCFAVRWDEGFDEYTRVVPAEKLLIDRREILKIIDGDPNLRQGISSWASFAVVSKSTNPTQVMEAERQRVDQLIHDSQLEAARKSYRDRCSFWWPSADFEQACREGKIRRIRYMHRQEIARLLTALRVEDAKNYFQGNCCDWYPEREFQELVQKAKVEIERLAELKRERARERREQRELEKQRGLKEEVLALWYAPALVDT